MAHDKKVLGDHVKRGNVFLPPYVANFGRMNEVSWARTVVPELLWIALVQRSFGEREGVRLITALARAAREVSEREITPIFGVAADFASLSEGERDRLCQRISTVDPDRKLVQALRPLCAHYPSFPLRGLLCESDLSGTPDELRAVRDMVDQLFQREDREPMMAQATFVWLAFDSGRLKVFKGLSLASFPEIDRYPETELSRRIGSSIRGTIHQFFGEETIYSPDTDWPSDFWRRGLEVSGCEFVDE